MPLLRLQFCIFCQRSSYSSRGQVATLWGVMDANEGLTVYFHCIKISQQLLLLLWNFSRHLVWCVVFSLLLLPLVDNHIVEGSAVVFSHCQAGGGVILGTENLTEVVRRPRIVISAVSCFVDGCQTLFSCHQLSRL